MASERISGAEAHRIVSSRVADTIVALATPPGRSAISVIRMSGERALDIAAAHIVPWPLVPRHVTLCRIHDGGNHETLDHALVTLFVNGDSFTGENLVEISAHGGHFVSMRVMMALISSGGRSALPGEFTRRAVLNGKMDITQAEAIGDLIDARSGATHRAAVQQMNGGLSRRVAALREEVIGLESLIAYDIDFPEEDDGPVSRDAVGNSASLLLASLDALLSTVPAGELIREGAVVVIAGEPNAGKSSLFNAFLGQSRAIVTDVPGTTRDAIEGIIETAQWPVRLVDTAGLRNTEDTVERLGIEVSERYLAQADVILACGDNRDSVCRTVTVVQGRSTGHVIGVWTKCDLLSVHEREVFERSQDGSDKPYSFISAETGYGLSALLGAIDVALTISVGAQVAEYPILMRARHIDGIQRARSEIAAFVSAWSSDAVPAPVAAVYLRTAAIMLEDLIGAVSTEDVLERVFRSFCVGK